MISATAVTAEDHSAIDAALGFYYQSLYGLLVTLKAVEDDATVCLERLDDVEIAINGQSLQIQLKHSLSKKPTGVSLTDVFACDVQKPPFLSSPPRRLRSY